MGTLLRRGGLADSLGPVEGDRRHVREELVELGIHDPAKVGHTRTIQITVNLLNSQQNVNWTDSTGSLPGAPPRYPSRTAPAALVCRLIRGGLVVPVPWQDGYQQAIEAHGAQLDRLDFPHDDHFSLPQSAAPQAQAWLAARFAG